MKKTALFFLLVSSSLFGEVSENITFKNEQDGEMCFTTIYINVKYDWLNNEFEVGKFVLTRIRRFSLLSLLMIRFLHWS